jgi:hypothetical protein
VEFDHDGGDIKLSTTENNNTAIAPVTNPFIIQGETVFNTIPEASMYF